MLKTLVISNAICMARLIPLFEQWRYLPHSCFKTNYEGKTEDLVDVFVHSEYLGFSCRSA